MNSSTYQPTHGPAARSRDGRQPTIPTRPVGCARMWLDRHAGLAGIAAGWALAFAALAAPGLDAAFDLMAAAIAAMWFGIGLVVGGGRR